jgi:hypothetical protein
MRPLHAISTSLMLAASSVSSAATPEMDPAEHAAHVAADPEAHQKPAQTSAGDADLAHQLSAMRDKVSSLEAQLGQAQGPSQENSEMPMPEQGSSSGMSSMGMTGMKGGMGMMNMGGGSMAASSETTDGGIGMGGMGMMQMGKMKMASMMGKSPMMGGMQGMTGSAPLPGFPGASHLYHLGATGFFLDHGSHISLTTEQTAALNKIREMAALATSKSDRAIEEAEEKLWKLTSSGQPDISAIQSQVEEISKLQADKRIAFIRSVGEAAKLLTEDQRKSLTGFAPAAPAMEGM